MGVARRRSLAGPALEPIAGTIHRRLPLQRPCRCSSGRWHAAMSDQSSRAEERNELLAYERQLLDALDARRDLRQIAGYPLLCALICALHRERRGQLPSSRMELYDVALQMLLERRDQERRIDRSPALGRTDKSLLLRDVAYWLIRNGRSSAPVAGVVERIAVKLTRCGTDFVNQPEASRREAFVLVEELNSESG